MNEAANLMSAGGETKYAPPGRRLAEARQAQKLTPADIARQLKLSVSQVEALEAGRYQQLPGPVFVRGFIRNYARLVKLDAGEVLREGGDSLPQPVPRRELPPSQEIPFPGRKASRRPLYAGVTVAIVGMLAIYEFYWNEPDATAVSQVVGGSSAVTVPPKMADPMVQAPPASTGDARPVGQARQEKGKVDPGTRALAAPRDAAAPAAPAEAERLPRAGERLVKLDFSDESWVEIRDRHERVIFSQLNRAGTQQQVHGLPPFSIVVGNAHGVRLTYEDRPVDLMQHTKIDVARLILQ